MIVAQAKDYIRRERPISYGEFAYNDCDFSPNTTAGWLSSWKRRFNFKSCPCNCEIKVWNYVRDQSVMSYDGLPDDLEEHFQHS